MRIKNAENIVKLRISLNAVQRECL